MFMRSWYLLCSLTVSKNFVDQSPMFCAYNCRGCPNRVLLFTVSNSVEIVKRCAAAFYEELWIILEGMHRFVRIVLNWRWILVMFLSLVTDRHYCEEFHVSWFWSSPIDPHVLLLLILISLWMFLVWFGTFYDYYSRYGHLTM